MLVSILINNYNYGRFLRFAIDSALAQTYRPTEVVVVDDGSTDDSRAIISSYQHRIIPLLKTNGGQASAFNAGFAACRGDLICFLDADDEFEPAKVQRVIDEQAQHPDTWYFNKVQFVNHDSRSIDGSPILPHASGLHDFRADSLEGKDSFWPPATSGLSFSRVLLERLIPMPEDIRITSDNYLKFSAIALVPGVIINEALSLQRIHGENAYTLKQDPLLRAETNFLTGKAIRQRHPELRKIGNRLVASGLGRKYRSGNRGRALWRDLIDYTSSLPVREKSIVYAQFCYNAFLKPSTARPKHPPSQAQINQSRELKSPAEKVAPGKGQH
jgi:glycosyltransferase involved in cell wall biosynthesis